jgi:hypothetical protein
VPERGRDRANRLGPDDVEHTVVVDVLQERLERVAGALERREAGAHGRPRIMPSRGWRVVRPRAAATNTIALVPSSISPTPKNVP